MLRLGKGRSNDFLALGSEFVAFWLRNLVGMD